MCKDHRCHGYIMIRAFCSKKIVQKWNSWTFHWRLYNKQNFTWLHEATKFLFTCWNISQHSKINLNKQTTYWMTLFSLLCRRHKRSLYRCWPLLELWSITNIADCWSEDWDGSYVTRITGTERLSNKQCSLLIRDVFSRSFGGYWIFLPLRSIKLLYRFFNYYVY